MTPNDWLMLSVALSLAVYLLMRPRPSRPSLPQAPRVLGSLYRMGRKRS